MDQRAGRSGANSFATTQITSAANYSNPKAGDPCHPLAAQAHVPAIAFQERGREGGPNLEIGGDVAFALTAPNGGGRAQERNVLSPTMQVRRLTPRECERLQGFDDDYTRLPQWKGWRKVDADESVDDLRAEGMTVRQNKKTGKWRVRDVDGPRYKALGNSWAVPNVRWIGRRIDAVSAILPMEIAA